MDRRLIFGFLPSWHNLQEPPNSYDQTAVDLMQAAHTQSARASLNWDVIEPNAPVGGQHTYQWSNFDQYMDLLVARKIEPIALVVGTPWWAKAISKTGTASSVGSNYLEDTSGGLGSFGGSYDIKVTSGANVEIHRIDHSDTTHVYLVAGDSWHFAQQGSSYEIGGHAAFVLPQEAYRASFEAFCQAAASHYQGKIRYFEFWNEPDGAACASFFNAATYTSWLYSIHGAVTGQNPDALISVGGLVNSDMGYLRGIYTAIAGRPDTNPDHYFDALAIHPYPLGDPPYPTPMNYTSIQNFRNELISHGDGEKSLWVTEYGWDLDRISETQQDQYLSTSLDWLFSADRYYLTVATFHVFADQPGLHWGVCDSQLSRRAAYYSFQAYAQPRTPTWESKAPFVTLV